MMSEVLEIKNLDATVLQRPRGDHRFVINRAAYDNYKALFKLTDNQMDTMFLVSDYIEIPKE